MHITSEKILGSFQCLYGCSLSLIFTLSFFWNIAKPFRGGSILLFSFFGEILTKLHVKFEFDVYSVLFLAYVQNVHQVAAATLFEWAQIVTQTIFLESPDGTFLFFEIRVLSVFFPKKIVFWIRKAYCFFTTSIGNHTNRPKYTKF